MKLLRPDGDKRNYVRIPTGLFALNLPSAQERLWIRLASLERGEFSEDYPTLDTLADATGISRSSFYRVFKEMRNSGLIDTKGDDLVLRLPDQAPAPAEPEQDSIAQEMVEAKPRKNTMSSKDAMDLVVNVWNEHKPESWVSEGKTLNPAVWIAFETQAKRLKVEREAYGDFLKAICRALKADEWWSSKSMKLTNVFGFSANIQDKKFQTVEKLYKQGQSKEVKSAAWTGTPADFLDWYNQKGYPVKEIIAVAVKDSDEAMDKEAAALETGVDRSVARVYYTEEKPVFWSGKMNQRPLYYLP